MIIQRIRDAVKSGRTLVDGEEQPAKLTRRLNAGEVVRIETPGGGGFGSADG